MGTENKANLLHSVLRAETPFIISTFKILNFVQVNVMVVLNLYINIINEEILTEV